MFALICFLEEYDTCTSRSVFAEKVIKNFSAPTHEAAGQNHTDLKLLFSDIEITVR